MTQAKLLEIAQVCDDIAEKNGFEKPTWENLISKLAFVITEIDEARDGAYGTGDPLEEELADIGIRLLSAMFSVWGPLMSDRISNRKPGNESPKYESIENLLWPIVGRVSKAMEAWRFDEKVDTLTHLELALLELWRLEDLL